MLRAETLFDRAVESFNSEQWSVAANNFDRLLDKYPDTIFTPGALILATEANIRTSNQERASRRLLNFREFFHNRLIAGVSKPGEREDALVTVIRLYASSDLQEEGLILMMELVPADIKPKDLNDKIYDSTEYLIFQLSDEKLGEVISGYPLHVLTPALQIHLARRAIMDGENERAISLISGIKTRSLRNAERTAIKEIRSMASGKGALEGKIALLLPFTGSYSQYARAVLEGVQMALHPSAGEPEVGLGLEIFDTGGEFQELMETIEHIIDDPEFVAILGPLSSSLTVTASLKLQDSDITLISPTASEQGLHELSKNIFSLNFIDETPALRIAEFAVQDLGLKNFAAIFPMDDYGYRMVNAFIERVEELGGNVLVAQGYPISATTFDMELKRIRYYSPEAVFIPAHSEEIPMIAPQIPFYGMEEVQLLGTNGWNNRRVARLGGKYVEGAYFTDTFFEGSPHLAYREFSQRYEEVYQREASRVAGLGYDAMNLIAWGLRMGGEGTMSRSVDFSDLEHFRGTTAIYNIGDEGYFQKEPLLLTISGGRIRSVDEVPILRGEMEMPTTTPLEPQLEAP
jgi:ABC-type branched-subunit amino acid transport system substrate-binding protein